MLKFSIIIPIFNVEKYLPECIDSVINQTYKNLEIILVDDGSPDECPRICDEYSSKDNRIKVIHKKNGGLSDARNAGLNVATGDYVVFIDSDDFFTCKQAIEIINQKILLEKTDFIMYRCWHWNYVTNDKWINTTEFDKVICDSKDKNKIVHYLFSQRMLPCGACVFALNKQIIDKNNLRFIVGIKAEDYDWVINVLLFANTFSAIDEPLYTYRHRPGSITSTADEKSVEDLMFTVDKWSKQCSSIDNDILKKDIQNYIAHIFSTSLVIIGGLNKQSRKKMVKFIKPYSNVLNNSYWLRLKLIKTFSLIFGLTLTSKILRKVFIMRNGDY